MQQKLHRLGALRAAVEPILANNLLPYFTAHDVSHCDRVTEVIDNLVEPLQQTDGRLTDDELFVLYAAAYLHDIGMQYERVGSSPVLAELGGRPWEDLRTDERRDLLRRLHPRISAELVRLSVRNAMPPIGLQLVDADHPNVIASLCEAHGIDSASERYKELTAEAPGLRPSLLSGLLRCADILEESRRRANRARAESLELPIESQVHWWRHYYTADVVFNRPQRTIDVWFDFPPDRRAELSRIIPDLQFPEIQAEFRRHEQMFAANGLTWFIRSRVYDGPYSRAETLPESVLYHMLVQIAARREADARNRQRALADLQEEARPFLSAIWKPFGKLRPLQQRDSPLSGH